MRREKPGQVKIIAGQWRGRSIAIGADLPIRPTPHRVRETLFNWLMHHIQGAVCLDLFAGSGAMGLEALSRGAQHAFFCDKHDSARAHLATLLDRWQIQTATILPFHWPQEQLAITLPVDLVFLDPPFYSGFIEPVCHWLEQQPFIQAHTRFVIEVEHPAVLNFPAHWHCHRQLKAGAVQYALWQRLLNSS